ncbi:hypothetical protein GOBAR_AA10419 [Gossypium barbadense]|uniref:Uncharacterized protein n=1 Tax=Gossypium barbadense TaxID=3634 RepID=A0A2P5Y3S6_GOSBA|nr:hypothetical protein GOBAR_AA10419 [Gossypium barbadense]
MLSKFISVSETRFQNTETSLKNQQSSFKGLETQIGQLSKIISERPQGSLPSNTEPNPTEHLNAIGTQDKEGFIAPEPEIQQDNAMNKGREEVNNNDPKQVSTNHEPRMPYPKAMTKDRTEEQFDAVDPHIVTTTPNEEIPLTVLSIFPFGTVEVSHPKFGTFKHTRPGTRARLKLWPNRGRDTVVRYDRVEAGHDFPKTRGAINLHGRAAWPWVNLIGTHGRGN